MKTRTLTEWYDMAQSLTTDEYNMIAHYDNTLMGTLCDAFVAIPLEGGERWFYVESWYVNKAELTL